MDEDQKHFSVGDELSLSIFLLWKDERALQIFAEQQFLAEIKVAGESSDRGAWYDWCAPSLSETAEEQPLSNQELEGDKIFKEDGIHALIPEAMTSSTVVAARSGLQVGKQQSFHGKSERKSLILTDWLYLLTNLFVTSLYG